MRSASPATAEAIRRGKYSKYSQEQFFLEIEKKALKMPQKPNTMYSHEHPLNRRTMKGCRFHFRSQPEETTVRGLKVPPVSHGQEEPSSNKLLSIRSPPSLLPHAEK